MRLRLRERSFDLPLELPAAPSAGTGVTAAAEPPEESACLPGASAAGRLGWRERLAAFGFSCSSETDPSVDAALFSGDATGPRPDPRPPLRPRGLRAGAELSSDTSEAESVAAGGLGIPRSLAFSRFKGSVIRRPSPDVMSPTRSRTTPAGRPAAPSGRKKQKEPPPARSPRELQLHRTDAWSAAVSNR